MRHIISAIICLVILAAGAGVAMLFNFTQPEGSEAAVAPPAPTPVRIEVVQPQMVEDEILLTGRLIPWKDFTLSAEIDGPIAWQKIHEGLHVNEGQPLIRIDTAAIESTIERAEAQAALARDELARAQSLRREGISSPQQLDRIRTDLRVAQSQLRSAKVELEKSELVAPVDAVVDTLYNDPGEFVAAGSPLVRLVQLDRVKAVVGMPERDYRYFSLGNPVKFTTDAFPGETFDGIIYNLSTSAVPETRTFTTTIAVENPRYRLRPGMTIRARLVRKVWDEAVTIPAFSVVSRENERFAVVEQDGEAHWQPVEVGRFVGDRIHIKSGLAPGDRVIVAGQHDVHDGEPVQVQHDPVE